MIEDARGIVEGARQDAYGSPLVNHERIAGLWSVILGTEISYQQVIQCMIAVKLARLCHSPDHRDSWQDIAGYAEVWSKAWTEKTETSLSSDASSGS